MLQGTAGNHLEIHVFALKEFKDLWNFESESLTVKALFDCPRRIMDHFAILKNSAIRWRAEDDDNILPFTWRQMISVTTLLVI